MRISAKSSQYIYILCSKIQVDNILYSIMNVTSRYLTNSLWSPLRSQARKRLILLLRCGILVLPTANNKRRSQWGNPWSAALLKPTLKQSEKINTEIYRTDLLEQIPVESRLRKLGENRWKIFLRFIFSYEYIRKPLKKIFWFDN